MRAYRTCGISSQDSKRRASALSTNCIGKSFRLIGTAKGRSGPRVPRADRSTLQAFELKDGGHRQGDRVTEICRGFKERDHVRASPNECVRSYVFQPERRLIPVLVISSALFLARETCFPRHPAKQQVPRFARNDKLM